MPSEPSSGNRAGEPADTGVSRRSVLAGAGTAGVVAVLSGCTTYGDSSKEQAQSGKAGDAAGGGAAFAQLADIPVGGGKIFADERVVVTQPEQGTIKAFSTVCTHQGCPVGEVSGGTINCPCHGSKFRIADGSVAGGPAPRPLPPAQVTLDGDAIKLA